jgi:hypothetical protein
MALPKRIKVGGAYYRGTVCSVMSASGEYTVVMTNTDGAAVNSVSVTPDGYGSNDTFGIKHYADSDGTGRVMAILAEDINNVGKGIGISLDFPAAELVNSGESLVFSYINTASVAMNVYLIAEYIGVRKTA